MFAADIYLSWKMKEKRNLLLRCLKSKAISSSGTFSHALLMPTHMVVVDP